jgi:hypothetical protein
MVVIFGIWRRQRGLGQESAQIYEAMDPMCTIK